MGSTESPEISTADVILIGGGIMSATLGVLLHELQPDWSIEVYERLDDVAQESSDPWNNAGTGHSGLCELNYTPARADGSIDTTTAVAINEQFQISRQLWTYLVERSILGAPESFINAVPHMTFVQGEKDIDFLRRRQEALAGNPLFASMQFSDDSTTISRWAPLLIAERPADSRIAVTYDPTGTDVDFGSLTRQMFSYLESEGVRIHRASEVTNLDQAPDRTWSLSIRNRHTSSTTRRRARFVFVGAGGWALKMLQRADLPEARKFAVVPVSGQFLRCTNPAVVAEHDAKIYGKAPIGAPPMSMPHLDTRVVNGTRAILFGPYAGANPKFLKQGSVLDLPRSIRLRSIRPLVSMALDNLSLVKLLVTDLAATKGKKIRALREFMPTANAEDWSIITAGQRAQIVKNDPHKGGVLQFGTEVVTAADGTIAGVLGASPGASTAVPIMLDLLQRCFPADFARWRPALKAMIPTFGTALNSNPDLANSTMAATARVLHLTPPATVSEPHASNP